MSRVPFLTDEEIRTIVKPLTQPAAIVRWFRVNGFTEMKIKPNGMPLISLEHFDAVAGGGQSKPPAPAQASSPDVEGYLNKINSRKRKSKKLG